MCCADFNAVSGLPPENTSYSYIFCHVVTTINNQLNFTSTQKSPGIFIQKQTSLFDKSGVRKRTDSY